MKKKQKQQHNPEKQTQRQVEYLQKKLNEEKQNLVRENKKLQKQIHEQIEQNRTAKMGYEKKEYQLQQIIQKLKIQNQNLRTQIILLQDNQQNEEQEQLEMSLKKTRDAYIQLTSQNDLMKNKLEEFQEIMSNMEEDIRILEKQNGKYKKKIKDQEAQIKKLSKQIEQTKRLYKENQQQEQKLFKEMEIKIEENSRLEAAVVQYKKKNKEINQTLKMLQEKLQIIKQNQFNKFQTELNSIRKEKQELEHLNMQKERNIEFLKISENQKTTYIQAITKELNELKNAVELNIKQNTTLSSNLQRVQNQKCRLLIEFEKQKSKALKDIQELNKVHEEQMSKIKKKTAQQVTNLIKMGADNKVIQNYMEGLKINKSQMNLRGLSSAPIIKYQEQKYNMPYQKLKYQNEILSLTNQIQNMKRQMQATGQEVAKLKRNIQQQKNEIEQRGQKLREQKLYIDKLQREKQTEEERLYRQLQKYKNIQTQILENKRTFMELEDATSLKIGYYDKKIKEYIDAIDRKDHIIQNYKNNKSQIQAKCKFLEDKCAKALEQAQQLRRHKNDNLRKEQLLKDYKDKIQKFKTQIQGHKSQIDKIKKQKIRLQRNLQSKQQYIATLKSKTAKQEQDKEQKVKEQKSLKETKEKYEGKLKKFKKQVEQLQFIIESIKSVIADKIKQAIKKSMSQQNTEPNSWQAAELLGLKSHQIQEFVNPTVSLDRNICQHLDQLWQKKQYQQFMCSSIDYLILKKQIGPDHDI